MGKKSTSPKLTDTAKGTLTFMDRGASIAKDLITLGLGSATLLGEPAALICLLCKGGLILADPLKKFLSNTGSEKPELTSTQTHAFLSGIFNDVATLRRSAVHAGRLIDEADAGQCRMEDLLLDADDPAASFLALYRAVKSGQKETQAALRELIAHNQPGPATSVPQPALSPEELSGNYKALLDLVATSNGGIRTALEKHLADLREEFGEIRAEVIMIQRNIAAVAELVSGNQINCDVSLAELRASVRLLLEMEQEHQRQHGEDRAMISRLAGQTIEPDYEASLRRIAAEHPVTVAQLKEILALYVSRVESEPAPSLNDQALAALVERNFSKAAETARTAYEEAIGRRAKAIFDSASATRDAIFAADTEAQALYEMADYENALAARQRIAALIDSNAQPLAWAGAQHMVATILHDLARHAEAVALLELVISITERELGPDNSFLASSLNNLALLLQAQGKLAEAEPFFRRAIKIDEAKLGENHPKVATDINNLASLLQAQGKLAEAEPLYRRALEIGEAKLGKDHPHNASWLRNLAGLLRTLGKLSEAEPLHRRALEITEAQLGKDHPHVAIGLNHLALLLQDQGKLAEAEPLFRRALEISEAKLGKDHPVVATRLNNLAQLLQDQGKLAEAEPLLRRAIEIDEAKLDKNHPDVASRLNNLALLLHARGELAKAEPLFCRALEISEGKLGKDHPDVAGGLHNLALLLKDRGKVAEAEPLHRRALEITEANLGKDHSKVALGLINLASSLKAQGKLVEAEPLLRRALEISEEKLGKDHPDVAIGLSHLAALLAAQGKLAEAEPLFRRALEITEAQLGKDHPDVASRLNNLGDLLAAQGKLAEAELLLRRALEISVAYLGKDHMDAARGFNNLASLLVAQGKLEEAEPLYRRMLGIVFFYRKRNGTPYEHEQLAVESFTLFLEDLEYTTEEIRAKLDAIWREAGLDA